MAKPYKQDGYRLMIPELLINSAAYRDLKPPARALLIEFVRIYRPSRNGNLSISTRNAVDLLNVTEPVALRAFEHLASHGFIKLTNHENWIERKARQWTLTFKECSKREPTDEWRQWEPKADLCPLPHKANKRKKRPKKSGAVLPMKTKAACQ